MSDDFVLNVKQIAQYPQVTATAPTDRYLLQQSGVGGPYMSIAPTDLVGTALQLGGYLHLAPNTGGIAFNGAAFSNNGSSFTFSEDVVVPSLHSSGDIFVAGDALATQVNVEAQFEEVLENSVWTFNGRKGNVQLETSDILRAGAAPISDAHFGGFNTSPTPWDTRNASDQIATCGFVQNVIAALVCSGSVVTSFNGRGGDITLTDADITLAGTALGAQPMVNTPPFGDVSQRIATTAFVDDGLADLQQQINAMLPTVGGYAPLNSPQFTGIPTAPTANPGTTTGQIATTSFVQHAVTAATTGVASFNTRTGAVVLTIGDVTGAGGAPLASPTFTGVPAAPTAAIGTNTTQLATTGFVAAALAGFVPTTGVTSFNARTGAVTLSTADITAAGGAPIASPALSGVPTAPTAAANTNTTQIATTQFVTGAIAALTAVTSFNGRTGAVTLQANDISAAGGALVASPAFTGTPTAPTPPGGTNNTTLATTAFVAAAIAAAGGVTSFNTRAGAVTLTAGDISGVGGALLASPAFSGVPTAPTAAQTSNDTTVATTAYVRAAMAAAGGVASFNARTGAVTLQAADVSAVGGALLASPAFTGTPTAPTVAGTDNSTSIATTAWVVSKIATAGGVTTFNTRAGAVTFVATDNTSGNLVLLTRTTISAPVTAVSFPNVFSATYRDYVLEFSDVTVDTNTNSLNVRFSTDGSTFPVTTDYYDTGVFTATATGATVNGQSHTAVGSAYTGVGLDATAGFSSSGRVKFFFPRSALYKNALSESITQNSGSGVTTYRGTISRQNTAALTGVQLFCGAGNMTAGVVSIYGEA